MSFTSRLDTDLKRSLIRMNREGVRKIDWPGWILFEIVTVYQTADGNEQIVPSNGVSNAQSSTYCERND